MNRDLSSVAVIQLPDMYILELRGKSTGGREQLVERVDLEFIGGIEQSFPPGTDVRDNVAGFVDGMNLATLLVISEALLSEAGREKAIAEYNGGRPATDPEEVDDEDDRSSRPR